MKTLNILLPLIITAILGWSCQQGQQATQSDQKFSNPLLGGDYPDPSIVRVGNDYYMTHSSFEYYPGLLIWHSTDMINWNRVAFALNTYVGSVWAPDLIYHNNTYFIYFPANRNNWVIYAQKPEGPWSEPINLNLNGYIDPGHVVDDEGIRYLYLSDGHLVQLSEDGLSTVGEVKHVYDGWEFPKEWSTECFCLESPKSTKRNGFYYLITAEGGTAGPATSHMVVSARANSPHGPWENDPNNPIVHTKNRNERWWSQGHGTLVDDIEGNWWIVYHGYEKGFHTLGRQTLLLPIEWTNDNWFKVTDGVKSDGDFTLPAGIPCQGNIDLSDNFEGNKPGLQWQFFKRYEPSRLTFENGKLTLAAQGLTFEETTPILVNVYEQKYETSVEYNLMGEATAGLTLYYNEKANVRVTVDKERIAVYVQQRRKTFIPNTFGASGHLKIVNDANEVSFHHSSDGKTWQKLDRSLDATGYNHNVFGEFLSLRAGLFVHGNGAAQFDNFVYNRLK